MWIYTLFRTLSLAGPYIKTHNNGSFNNFLKYYGFRIVDYNDLEIVNKRIIDITGKCNIITDNFDFKYDQKRNKKVEIYTLVKSIVDNYENTIVYCKSQFGTQKMAKVLVDKRAGRVNMNERLEALIQHLEHIFKEGKGKDWIVTKALKMGIGVHHGCVPKYVQQEIIDLFNNNSLSVLIATTTITEGVNTSSKNIIITSSKKGSKDLKKFDALNIEGRAGRFFHHYSGRVFIADEQFNQTRNKPDEELHHKNFQKEVNKTDVELKFVDANYLNEHDQQEFAKILVLIKQVGLDEEVLRRFKTIPDTDKCKLYPYVIGLNQSEITAIDSVTTSIMSNSSPLEAIQIVIDKTSIIFPEKSRLRYLSKTNQSKQFSTLAYLIYYYLKDGFAGNVNYFLKSKDVDHAAIEAARFAFTTLKYEVVKYFGLFNLIYKVWQAKQRSCSFDDVNGIDLLLNKCEYSALTTKGRKASDFGVTPNIIKYYDASTQAKRLYIKNKMDKFELLVFNKVSNILDS